MSETYAIIIRGEKFVLSQAQVEYDSPNYFTACFLGEFTWSQSRALELSRDPELFKIVLNYLSGYEVLPLHESAIPKRMSSQAVLRNLLADAEFYQLDELVDQLNSAIEDIRQAPYLSPYVLLYMVS
ncbi:hypothetical protein RhiLY_12119 [Ceratobasidium sp. AG-Ba]|nr:hypothetical protein RhiLY_12119 [Ceratobasidium sp. AG-Ba]